MTSEDDFQKMLDEDPSDWQTRLLLADYLEELGDKRAAGYRALGMCRVYPFFSEDVTSSWCYHNGKGTTSSKTKGIYYVPIPICHRIPSQRWLDLIQDEEYITKDREKGFVQKHNYETTGTILSSCLAETRKWLEDCAALAFLDLEPLEQKAMLSGDA